MDRGARASLKERAVEEFKLFWIIALYLWVFLGSFTVYRRLFVAFVPFFAFGEIGRVLGPQQLAAMFFGRREAVQTTKESR